MAIATNDYIYAEPDTETREVFLDTYGKPHNTREDAIAANVLIDALCEFRATLVHILPDSPSARDQAAKDFFELVRRKPQLFRELIEVFEG
jgi:hypothetical protein